MKTSDVLNKAADLIEERGWVKGEGWVTDLTPDGAPLCLEGGIQAALGMRVKSDTGDDRKFAPLLQCPAYRAVSTYLDREHAGVEPCEVGFTGQPLYWWNDERETADEVIATLRAVAVIEAAREEAAEPVAHTVPA
jgi:hypothetical protein